MMKRLLNLHTIQKITLILTTLLLLLPSIALAEDTYSIIVGGNTPNRDGTITGTNITGGTITFDANNNTLTLSGVTIDVSVDGGYAIESNIDNLVVYLEGRSTIICKSSSSDKGAFKYTGDNTQAKVTFNTNTSDYKDFGSLTVNNIYSMSQFFSGYTASNDNWFNNDDTTEKDGWYYKATNNASSSEPVTVKYRKYYDLWFGIYSDGAVSYAKLNSDREGDYFTFNAEKSILSYSYFGQDYAFKSSLPRLTVVVNETARLGQITFSPKDGVSTGELAFSISPGAELKLENSNGVILGFSSVSFENGTKLTSPDSAPSTWNATITSATITGPESYNIIVGNIPVSENNANDVLGNGGSVKYNSSEHTLTLTNANIDLAKNNNEGMPAESPGIDYQGSESLIIELIGTNRIISSGGCDVIQCSSPLDIRPNISFENRDGNPCSLELEGGSGNVISGFRNISGLSNVGENGNNLVLVYDKDVSYSQEKGLYCYEYDGTGATNTNPVSNATIATDYHLRIGNVYVTNLNSENVLSNTSNDGKLSYSPQTNILSFKGAEILQPLHIDQGNLTIDLEGNNSITIKEEDEPESSAIIAETCSLTIKSTSKTGSLALSSSGGCQLTRGIVSTIIKPLVSSKNIANEEVTMATIHPVYPPIASNTRKTSEGISILLENSEDNGGSGIIKYSIENADKSTGISNQTFSPETGISMTKPGTLTAWIELDSENKSSDLVGKFFGYKQKIIRKEYNGTDAVTFSPEIVPEIEDDDNITVTYEMESGNATLSENVIRMSSYGSAMIAAKLEQPSSDIQHTYKLNPDTIQIKVMAVPAAPSIPEENSIFLNTDKIAISSTALSGTTICYKWDNGADKTYSDKIAIEGSTLSAWVKYQPYSDAEPIYSDTISATYTIKTNIEGFVFTPSAITDTPYTSSAITPNITISSQDGTTLTNSDYSLSYKQVVGNDSTTVESAINVGSYILTIEGKGSYGGKKEMPFNIVKATPDWTSDSWTAPEPKSELIYTGEAVELITGAIKPEEATIKYLAVFNPESYDYAEGANEEWTTTIPTGNAPGNYAIFYKIEGGDNYEDWGPSEVGIKATIDKGEASITAEDMTSTYTGEPIVFDKNKVDISNSTISKDGINFKYFAPNPENPEESTLIDNAPTNIGIYNVEISLEDNYYSAESITATLTITAGTMTVTAAGYEGTYDNQAHGITVSAPEGATVKYGSLKGTYNLTESPKYTDAGTYKVHYQVTMDNYTNVTDSAKVEISKADITPAVTLEGWTFGTTANTPSVTGNSGNGAVTYTYKAEGTDTFVEAMPEVVGTHTIKASIAETTNYNAGEATATFTITASTMTVTANGYEGTYDGKAHGITVTAPEGAKVMYGTQKDTYNLTESPTYTNAGTYKVHYQVTMDNHTTVADSATVKISKAEAELEFDVPEEGKVYATIGKEFTEPTLSNLHELSVTYGSSDESVATVDETTGKVTLISAGLTYITATFAGNNNYNELEVKYELRVKGTYNLWINNVQVTSDNYNDILENQKFFYDLVNKWLIITDNETPVTVKSSMPELTIYLNGKSELERIYFDNQGNAQNTGTLSFITYSDLPGKLILDTNNENGVISGFSSISFDEKTNLRIIEPDSCEYKDGLLKMTRKDQLGDIVKIATIGQYIEPMVNGDGIDFDKDIDGNTNITNITIDDKLLITAMQHEEDTNEDDDYYDPSSGAIVLNTTNTSEDVEVLSQEVESGNKTPGSGDYADSFRGGITFMVPSGKGTIELEVVTGEGYMLMLKIGTGEPHEIIEDERATVTIEYDVEESTYVYLYLQEKTVMKARWAGNTTRVGKRDKAHGRIYSVKVKASVVKSSNPLNSVEGAKGNVTIPTVNTVSPSNDDDVPTKAEFEITNDENNVNDDKWFTIDGRRIDKPTQKGLYIRNRKKIVVK